MLKSLDKATASTNKMYAWIVRAKRAAIRHLAVTYLHRSLCLRPYCGRNAAVVSWLKSTNILVSISQWFGGKSGLYQRLIGRIKRDINAMSWNSNAKKT